ncbi:hypothetical protein BaRGS_00029387 [Batillaria attramentaria]|uniref:ZU5 domain-containing protein n=1 Tax=Batillaria attramentaria TaxID=370345 RepID=A0ABD0JXU2_9CAEN
MRARRFRNLINLIWDFKSQLHSSLYPTTLSSIPLADGDQTNVGDDSGPNYADADKTTRPISIIRWLKSKNNKNARYVRDPTAKETGQPNPTVHMEEGEIEEQGFDETDAAGAEMYEITETNQPSGARSYENQAFDHPDDLPSLSQQHTETGDEYIVMGSVEQMQEKSGSEPQAGVDSKSNGAGEEDLYQNTSPKAEWTSRSPSDTPPRGNAKSGIYQNTEILSFRSKTVNPRDSGYGTLMTEQETETYLKKQHQLKGQVKKLDTEYENVDFGPRKSTKPMFGQEWQFSQTFSSEVGSLRGDRSDVCLQVPVGAIVTGSQVTIKGAVSTSLDEIENKLNRKLRKDEYIVSPVIEYNAGPKFVSKKPMCIVLPHFLNSLNESVNVYRIQREKGRGYVLQTLKQVGRDELNEESAQANIASTGVYYFGDKGRIHILTCHFSGYFCTHCGENFTSPELHLEVRAKYSSERKRPVAEVRLDIWDSRFNIQDFRQNRPEQDSFHFKGMRKMDVKILPALSKDENLSLIELGVRLELEEDDTIWTIEMKQLVPCNCRPRFPYRVDWHLTTKNDGAGGQVECSVDVGYVRISADARSSQLPFDYLPRPKYVTIAVCVGPESKESGAAQGHEARVAGKAPSVSSRREVAPHSMSAVRPVQTPAYRPTHEPQPSPYAGLGAEGAQLQYPTPSREHQPSPSQSQHFSINTVGHLTIGGDPGSWNPQVQQAQFAMDRLSETDPRRESLTSQEPLYMNLSDHVPVPASGDDNSQREV